MIIIVLRCNVFGLNRRLNRKVGQSHCKKKEPESTTTAKKKELNVHMLVGEGKKVKLNNLCYLK